ncbi:hypothetical protein ABK040_004721 [Willaertia magna]
MNGKTLHQRLRKIHYGDVEKFPSSKQENYILPSDPTVLDWIFNCDDHSTNFLTYLCENETLWKENETILTEEDLKEFERLKKEDKLILNNNLLEEALQLGEDYYKLNIKEEEELSNILGIKIKNLTDKKLNEKLEDYLEELNDELDLLENQFEKKKIQRDQLMKYSFTKNKKNKNLINKEKLIKQNIYNRNNEWNRILNNLKQSMEDFVNIHLLMKDNYFISNCNLQNFINEDEILCKEMEQYIKSYYEEESLNENINEYDKHSKELKRLKSIYKSTEEQYIISLINKEKSKASLEYITNQKEQLTRSLLHVDNIDVIKETIDKTQKQINSIKLILLNYLNNDIPQLMDELIELHSVHVLDNDYLNRIEFEKKKNLKLENILKQMIQRNVKLDSLKESIYFEYKKIYENYLLLNCIINELSDIYNNCQERIFEYNKLIESHQIENIHSTNNNEMIDKLSFIASNNGSRIDNLLKSIQQYQQDTIQMKNQMNETIIKVIEKNESLEECFFHQSLKEENYHEITPHLINRNVIEEMQTLKTQTDNIGNLLKQVIEEKVEKEQFIQFNEHVQKERSFEKVFTN